MRIEPGQRFCDLVRQIDGDEESLVDHADSPRTALMISLANLQSSRAQARDLTQRRGSHKLFCVTHFAHVRSLLVCASRDDRVSCEHNVNEILLIRQLAER